MKKLVAVCISIAGLAPIGTAQSGRNTERPTPTPQPPAAAVQEYSESTPGRSRAITLVPKTSAVNAPAASSPAVADSDEVITIDTSLVTVPVSVFDRRGIYIPDLQRSEFRIFEDGVEQEISYFGTSDKPFTVVLLLDTSLSTNYKIEEIQRAAVAFVDQLKSEDAVAVIEFDRDVNVLTDVTRDRTRIYRAIAKADFGGGTSLYDAVLFSLRKRLNKIEGRKAIVLFTDGVDTTSENAGYDTTLAIAEEADALIFPIYYNTFDWNNSGARTSRVIAPVGTTAEEYEIGRRYLVELAESTGGRVFRPEATADGLTDAFRGIAEELRRQYNIGYIPTTPGSPGQRKQIRVRVNRPNLILRARDSYIVGTRKKTDKR